MRTLPAVGPGLLLLLPTCHAQCPLRDAPPARLAPQGQATCLPEVQTQLRAPDASCYPPTVHPDFDDTDADVTLISGDETHTYFYIASSHLSRTAEFFRGMFELPQTSGGRASLTVDEDALTLEILLKLATGVPAGLRRLQSMDDIERILRAAEKYGMKGAEEVLAFHLTGLLTKCDPLRTYALACRHGWDDMADIALEKLARGPLDLAQLPSMDTKHLLRLLLARKDRLERFSNAFNTSPLFSSDRVIHNVTCRRYPSACGQPAQSLAAVYWRDFKHFVLTAYATAPSIDAVLLHPSMDSQRQSLAKVLCTTASCRRPIWPWHSIVDDLRKCETDSAALPAEST